LLWEKPLPGINLPILSVIPTPVGAHLPRFMFSIEFISVSATPVMVLSSIWI
jgi:hypothetical protein